jgi:thiol-disulfide isomerase/thioredoxin
VRRTALIITASLLILAFFAWAGWSNLKYRKQAAQRMPAAQAEASASTGGSPQYVSPLQGEPAPPFTLEDINGQMVSLASFKGKALVINFWATWCVPCNIETPWLIELRNRYAPQGLEVLAISADDLDRGDPAKLNREKRGIERFVQRMRMPYPVLLDADSISRSYGGLDALPSSFFVNRDGTVVAAQLGISSKDELEANIKKALGKN